MNKEEWKVLTSREGREWNRIVKSCKNWDVYYLWEYVEALFLHGDGEPLLFYMEKNEERAYCVTLKSDIANSSVFQERIPKQQYFDMETPYGYGGLIQQGEVSAEFLNTFFKKMTEYCVKENIVSLFYRFHPLFQNQKLLAGASECSTFKESIYMDTSSEEVIWENMDTKNRNMIRKARKNGIQIFCDDGEHLDEFIQIYESTMDRNQASDYYYFPREYFEFLIKEMKDNFKMFYAVYEEKIISASIIMFNENYMHYHLSGTLKEYMKLASTNLLLYEAACWGSRRGIQQFHLGGGVSAQDSLFGFKKQFNRKGYLDFYIGRTIFMPDKYQELMEVRKKHDPEFNMENKRMIQYRG